MADDEKGGSLTVEDALKMYESYKSYWDENYREAAIDLKMAAGDKAAHWGDGWDSKYKLPDGPAPVVNELPQYIHQVTNDIRQNVPSIKVLPVSDGDIETGKIYTGLFRAIEDHSHADEVCDTAAEYAVTCSIGFMRLDHDYCNDDTDEQEIVFKTVSDPLSTWIDPASVEYDGRDANGAISLEPINKKDFERLYPKKAFSSFTDPKADASKKDSIVLAEIFIREISGKRGKSYTVRRYKVSGEDILAETTFPGIYIPVVPIYGQVKWIDGKRVLESLIRQARDPQRRLNHWAAKESQLLSMAPIAPVMAEEGTLVNERGQWQSPGTEMVLEYRKTNLDGSPANIPTRLQPPPVPTGIINAMEGAKENIKESMGIYNAGLGKREGDASGIALQQLDKSGDVATFHYPDNVRRSYGHMGEIAVEMMPVIYDTPRIIQTLNDETDVVMVGINGAPMQDGQKQAYDLTKGKYRVRITTGASYTTKRQEEANFLSAIFQKDPALMQIGGDILFKSMDTPGAQALAARFKKTLPPQLVEDNNQQDPQVMQLTQKLQETQTIIQQGAQEIQQLQAQLQNKQGEEQLKGAELQVKQQELQVKQTELQVKLAQLQAPAVPPQIDPAAANNAAFDQSVKEREVALKERETELKEAEFMLKANKEINQPEGNAMGVKDDTAEMLQSKLQQKLVEQNAKDEASRQEAEEAQMRAQQTQAIIQSLATIAQQLNQLTTQVAQPKKVIRDGSGVIQGVQ